MEGLRERDQKRHACVCDRQEEKESVRVEEKQADQRKVIHLISFALEIVKILSGECSGVRGLRMGGEYVPRIVSVGFSLAGEVELLSKEDGRTEGR